MNRCAACRDPLVVEIDPQDDDLDVPSASSSSAAAAATAGPQTVPDDIQLIACGCHYHWQCLLDAYSVTECPSCGASIVSQAPDAGQQVLSNIDNEGGTQQNVDILPLLSEEGYLKAYPEERKCRAFLEFCRQGDVEAIVEMLQGGHDDDSDSVEDEDEDGDVDAMDMDAPSRDPVDLLRYQDALGDNSSALHAAVASGSQEVAWLLLLLSSNLDLGQFPPQVLDEAKQLGLARGGDQAAKVDIRSLRDAEGRTAEDLAAMHGGVWQAWLGNRWLAV
ncbi:hypothetical protein IWX49DRAFT_587347 [Phyllosticta citricarpa]|uniref:RING-type domain-containing protein n=2 Tax=Phyllosticta TaxID=121621 RepID=A0ABR1MNU3_9PEZI